MNDIKQNKAGHSVNGRTLRQPDYEMYKKMAKKQQAERLNAKSKLSNNTASNNPLLILDEEEKQEIAKDFTSSILLKSGSAGGNKTLFVNSREAFYPQNQRSLGGNNSPLGMNQSGTGFNEHGMGVDYHSLKRNSNASKVSNKMNSRASSLSMVRLERELNIGSRVGTADAAKTAEQLINDLTSGIDEQ